MNYLDNTKQALALASDKLAKADLFGAVTVMHAALEQVVAHLRNEDLNNVSDPDLILHFEEDCGDEEEEA
jgi:hypothetical protein